MVDWPTEIAVLGVIKSTMAEADPGRIFEYRLPRVGATEAELASTEAALGINLPAGYREFLAYANGWQAYWHGVDLYGTPELEGDEARSAREMMRLVEPGLSAIGLVSDQVLAIGVNRDGIDVFVIELETGKAPGRVHWIAGAEVQAFPDFSEFYLAMLDYSRLDIEWLRKRSGRRSQS